MSQRLSLSYIADMFMKWLNIIIIIIITKSERHYNVIV